ncbi:HEAT repeat domain-containing protein [Candidatus Berkelbacteria bacterium]|nr:HEAT repeat domain-containing protein [Candidatus Berkelbacteria bacterium]
MPPTTRRLALKPDSSFFRKIVIGVVGARAVANDLGERGHRIVELERGATDTKLWKDVKRKRVRIPDLVCVDCGVRVESRAKTKPELSMSHSLTGAERAWDFGMVKQDYVALPVCEAADESYWSGGDLSKNLAYWHERNWVRWKTKRHINYFRVGAFRSASYQARAAKGVTEGSETSIIWKGTFSTRAGVVDGVEGANLTIRRDLDGHRHTWKIGRGMRGFVTRGEAVQDNQLIAGDVEPLKPSALLCPKTLPADHIPRLLESRERTLRFTGVKLARLRADDAFRTQVDELTEDADEDIYIRLEGCSYLASVCGRSAQKLFKEYIGSADPQTQLEAVIALGETGTSEAIQILCVILDDASRPYFLRSAAAWALAQSKEEGAISRLVRAFADVDHGIRDEALTGLVTLGGPAVAILLERLKDEETSVSAGCAEALRQLQPLPREVVDSLTAEARSGEPTDWAVWLLGHLPREQVAPLIAELQQRSPEIHYAISLLWSFVESWIARRWELRPRASNNNT